MATRIESQLALLTNAIQKLVDNPVAVVAPVAPVAPVLPVVMQHSGDHDLLVQLDQKVSTLQVTVNKMVDSEERHVTLAEFTSHVQASDVLHKDHEDRLRTHTLTIEQVKTQLKVGWGAVVFAMGTLTVIAHFWH